MIRFTLISFRVTPKWKLYYIMYIMQDYFLYVFKVQILTKFIKHFQTIFQFEIYKLSILIANIRHFNKKFPTKCSTFNKRKSSQTEKHFL